MSYLLRLHKLSPVSHILHWRSLVPLSLVLDRDSKPWCYHWFLVSCLPIQAFREFFLASQAQYPECNTSHFSICSAGEDFATRGRGSVFLGTLQLASLPLPWWFFLIFRPAEFSLQLEQDAYTNLLQSLAPLQPPMKMVRGMQ